MSNGVTLIWLEINCVRFLARIVIFDLYQDPRSPLHCTYIFVLHLYSFLGDLNHLWGELKFGQLNNSIHPLSEHLSTAQHSPPQAWNLSYIDRYVTSTKYFNANGIICYLLFIEASYKLSCKWTGQSTSLAGVRVLVAWDQKPHHLKESKAWMYLCPEMHEIQN